MKNYIVQFAIEPWTTSLSCPLCDNENVHPVAVAVNPGGRHPGSVEVKRDGIHLDRTVKPDGRGVLVVLRFQCESGHRFALDLHFHKGATYTELRQLDDGEEDTIWRD